MRICTNSAEAVKNLTYSINLANCHLHSIYFRLCTLVSHLFNFLNGKNVIAARDATSAWQLIPEIGFEPMVFCV